MLIGMICTISVGLLTALSILDEEMGGSISYRNRAGVDSALQHEAVAGPCFASSSS